MENLTQNQRVALLSSAKESTYKTGIITKLSEDKSLVKFDNMYSRWCKNENIKKLS